MVVFQICYHAIAQLSSSTGFIQYAFLTAARTNKSDGLCSRTYSRPSRKSPFNLFLSFIHHHEGNFQRHPLHYVKGYGWVNIM